MLSFSIRARVALARSGSSSIFPNVSGALAFETTTLARELAAVGRPDADGGAVLHQDLLDARPEEDLSAAVLDALGEGVADASASRPLG